MIEPNTATNTETPNENDPHQTFMTYSDSLIDFTFYLNGTPGNGYDGPVYIYSGISFILVNKTDSVVILDWNKFSFIDARGSSGNSIMHENIKYNECGSNKPATVIPPHGKITDNIIPCYGLTFMPGSSSSTIPVEAYWHKSALPLPGDGSNVSDNTKITFGLYLPISIGSIVKNYTFSFKGEVFSKDN
jgi:hypothetical protein